MRVPVASLLRKSISTFFAIALIVGLVPAVAFADDGDARANDVPRADAAQGGTDTSGIVADTDVAAEDERSDQGAASDPANADDAGESLSADEVINQEPPSTPVAQAESFKSFFLAQTLEFTKTVPVVSAKLPIDDGALAPSTEGEDAGSGALGMPISSDSVVVGSFESDGIVYAVEPGGESVAAVAVDYRKLPQDSLETRTIDLSSMVFSEDGISYSVTRIANAAFSSLSFSEEGDVAEGGTSSTEASDGGSGSDSSDDAAVSIGSSDGGDDAAIGSSDDDGAAIAVLDDADRPSTSEGFVSDVLDAIETVSIPGSVTSVEKDAFSGSCIVSRIIVADDNQTYSSYDGCLYDEPLTSLLLIPEGRTGAVRIAPSAVTIDPEVFSHCPSVGEIIVDADSAAFSSVDGFLYDYDPEASDLPVRVMIDGDPNVDGFSKSPSISESEMSDSESDVLASDPPAEEVVPAQQRAVCDASAGATTLEIGDRDTNGTQAGSFSFQGKALRMRLSQGGYWFFAGHTDLNNADGTVSWTGGTAEAPTAGSIVTVNVSRYASTGPEGVRDVMTACTITGWGASENREMVGIRNRDTGSYTSMDSIFSGGAFSFSFVMPKSGCTVSPDIGLDWTATNSTFDPVFVERSDAIYNYYKLNSEGESNWTTDYGWTNSVTGVTVGCSYVAATYSTVGGLVVTPPQSIPVRAGYTFLGWYTAPEGGDLMPSVARAEDNGRTYYAHWAQTTGSLTIKGGKMGLKLGSLPKWYLTGGVGSIDAVVIWTGGSKAAPAAGSIVSVQVTRYEGNGPEAVRGVHAGLSLSAWGASESRELVGARCRDTGSYFSVDSIFSGESFSFSFVMPASGCTIDATQFMWVASGTSFEPCYEDRTDAIYNSFVLSDGCQWRNAVTGRTTANAAISGYPAAAYSTVGGPVNTPVQSIPIRQGYTFLGWYTAPEGGDLMPSVARAEDNGRTYYAHWGETGTTIRIGERDANGNPTGTGGTLNLAKWYERWYISAEAGFWADISWTGGGSVPSVGSIVNVQVLRLHQAGAEATLETMINASLLTWGASVEKEFVGIRNPDTGSYISAETIQGGDAFSFSFVMPASGCDITANWLAWPDGARFDPVFKDREGAVLNSFMPNSPSGATAQWMNSSTRKLVTTATATTYSDKGSILVTPQNAIPYCQGYTFLGWYTEAKGGVPAPLMTTDEGATYYAHWGNKDSRFYYVQKYDNIPGSDALVQNTNSIEYGYSFSDFLFERTGHSILKWTGNADGSGTSYDVNVTYPAPAEGTWLAAYAQWALDRYTIAYDLAGGSWGSDAGPDHYDYAGSTSVSIPDPVREGYLFAGWTGTGLASPTTNLEIDAGSNDKLGKHTAGTNLYARSYAATWIPITYEMTFDLSFSDGSASWKEGEDPSEGAYGAIAYDGPVTFPAAPVRAGWIFTGWKRSDGASYAIYAAGQTVEAANFASVQDETVPFEARWTRNLEVTVPLGSKEVGLSVSVDLVAGEDAGFAVGKGTSEIVNLSDGEMKVVSVAEDASDPDALGRRRENALEAFGGPSADPSKLSGVSLVLSPTSDGTTVDASKEQARFPLFGSHALTRGTWLIPASADPAGGTEGSTLRILYDLDIDRARIAVTDLELNLEAKPISSLVFTVELADPTEPDHHGAGA